MEENSPSKTSVNESQPPFSMEMPELASLHAEDIIGFPVQEVEVGPDHQVPDPNVDPDGSPVKNLARSPRSITNEYKTSSVSSEVNYQDALPALSPCSSKIRETTSLTSFLDVVSQTEGKMVNSTENSRKRLRMEKGEEEEEEGTEGNAKKIMIEGKIGNSLLGESYNEESLISPDVVMHVENEKQTVEITSYQVDESDLMAVTIEMEKVDKSVYLENGNCLTNGAESIELEIVDKSTFTEEKFVLLNEKCLSSGAETVELEMVDKIASEEEISVLVNENLTNGAETAELEIMDKSVSEKEKIVLVDEKCLINGAETEMVDKSASEEEKNVLLNEKCLGDETVELEMVDKSASEEDKNVLVNEKCLVNGTELVDNSTCEKEKDALVNENCLMNGAELVDKSTSEKEKNILLNEKCGSETIETKMVGKSVSAGKRSASAGKKSVSVKKGQSVSSEKSLRSRKISYTIVEGEDDGTNKVLFTKGSGSKGKKGSAQKSENSETKEKSPLSFVGEPIPEEEAMEKYQWRYDLKSKRSNRQGWIINAGEEDEMVLNVKCHYAQAKVGKSIINIGDCVYVKGEGKTRHIGKILEFFKTVEGEDYFRVQWFFKAEDTVIQEAAKSRDEKRVFYSALMNDNLLDCIIRKIRIVETTPGIGLPKNIKPQPDFYYDMEYCVEYSTFRNLVNDGSVKSGDLPSVDAQSSPLEGESVKKELALLDLYSGCGGMSTGLCLGAKLSGINLVTRWAIDSNKAACDSLKLNHPETQVRNVFAEDFLELLKRWEELCKTYGADNAGPTPTEEGSENPVVEEEVDGDENGDSSDEEIFEVENLLDIHYGFIDRKKKKDLYFKVRWKGYGPEEDTWEPIEGLSGAEERIREFVKNGLESKILPLPGHVGVICGGPPCQGISGYNRYRNTESPLDDDRNRQIIVYMDIVEYLKPKYVLMENVTDILRFDKGSLGRYALGRLVHMKYQARLGIMAAGCYGIPQFRLRVFIWGALFTERLPQFPLPTHDVIVRYWPPPEFERSVVAYDEGQPRQLEEAVVLRDAISDLPSVTNFESNETMAYLTVPQTEFQKHIRTSKWEMMGLAPTEDVDPRSALLFDHRPLIMSEDNLLRVSQIPHRKGANFRDFPGVCVGSDNVVCRDPSTEMVKLPSGEPLVPECCFTFEGGKSKRPFGRLWWDENVATVITVPNVRSHKILHPEQDRIVTVREYARLQGFPDFYRFSGTVKERYCQVGNAVAVPVARALGYSLGMAFQKLTGEEPLMQLPPKFASQIPVVEKDVLES